MTAHAWNIATRWIVIVPWLVWLVWELVVIAVGKRVPGVETISQEARRLAYRGFPTLAYFWCGMASHWFITWRKPVWEGTLGAVLAVLFWAIGAAYLLADWLDPNRAHWPALTTWLRYPPIVACVGLAAGYLLFPQRSVWTP